jgi:hypothetical protein
VDRPGAVIIGATLMVAFNVLTLGDAVDAINTDTILLLFGMMIVVANLRLSGIFAMVTEWAVEHAHRPLVLRAAIVAVSGVFSAFFVNDTMCLVLTPLMLGVTTQLQPGTLSAGRRNVVEHRKCRNGNGQSPEHARFWCSAHSLLTLPTLGTPGSRSPCLRHSRAISRSRDRWPTVSSSSGPGTR